MITAVTQSGVKYQIPTSPQDVRVKHWFKWISGLSMLEALTGINADTITGKQALDVLSGVLWWVPDFTFPNASAWDGPEPESMEYNRYSHCLLMFDKSLKARFSFIFAAYHVDVFTLAEANEVMQKVPDLPAIDAVPSILYLNEKVIEMSKNWQRLLGKEPDALQKRAGIKELSVFGDMATMHELAGGDLEKADRYRNRSFNEILTTLYYLRKKDEYNEKYYKIKAKEKPH